MKINELDNEYLNIVGDIVNNDKFNVMMNTKHHNTTRFNHMLKVSYRSYKISKKLNLDYKSTARAALLHDYYIEEINDQNSFKYKFRLFSKHPEIAVNNAKKIVDLNEKEENIIKTHMFPAHYKIPTHKESWVVSIIDKYNSIGEFYHLYSYKLAYLTNFLILLLLRK